MKTLSLGLVGQVIRARPWCSMGAHTQSPANVTGSWFRSAWTGYMITQNRIYMRPDTCGASGFGKDGSE